MSDFIYHIDMDAFIEEVAKFGVSSEDAIAGCYALGEVLENHPWFGLWLKDLQDNNTQKEGEQ